MVEENGKIVFQKKDYVYAETIGVCKVEEVPNLATKNGIPTPYYGLRSVQNKTTTAYFPVEGHEVNIRPLITLEEADEIMNKPEEDKKQIDEKLLFEAEFVIKNKK